MKNIILYQIHLYYIVLKNTTITHDCEMLEYWTEKTFPDGSTFSLDIINKSKFSIQLFFN